MWLGASLSVENYAGGTYGEEGTIGYDSAFVDAEEFVVDKGSCVWGGIADGVFEVIVSVAGYV